MNRRDRAVIADLTKRVEELEFKNRLVIETLADMCRRADVPFIADLGLALGGLVDQVPPERMAMYEEEGQRLLDREKRDRGTTSFPENESWAPPR